MCRVEFVSWYISALLSKAFSAATAAAASAVVVLIVVVFPRFLADPNAPPRFVILYSSSRRRRYAQQQQQQRRWRRRQAARIVLDLDPAVCSLFADTSMYIPSSKVFSTPYIRHSLLACSYVCVHEFPVHFCIRMVCVFAS